PARPRLQEATRIIGERCESSHVAGSGAATGSACLCYSPVNGLNSPRRREFGSCGGSSRHAMDANCTTWPSHFLSLTRSSVISVIPSPVAVLNVLVQREQELRLSGSSEG